MSVEEETRKGSGVFMNKDEKIMTDTKFKANRPQYNHARKSQSRLEVLKDENIMIDSMFKAKKPQYNHARKSQLVLDIMNDEDLNNSQPLFTPMFNSSLDIK